MMNPDTIRDAIPGNTPEAADQRHAALNGDESVIPQGCYCYTPLGVEPGENGAPPRLKIKLCPYWARHPEQREQEDGYCAKLKSGDWEEEGTFLLWDQCKECGINDDDFEDFEDTDEDSAADAPDEQPVQNKRCGTCQYGQYSSLHKTLWCYHPGRDEKTTKDFLCKDPCDWRDKDAFP